MGKVKKDEEHQIKVLEGKIRELKALNRILNRKLRAINKGYRKLREEPEIEEVEEITGPSCPDCSSSTKTHELMGRSWEYCESCLWRSPIKIK